MSRGRKNTRERNNTQPFREPVNGSGGGALWNELAAVVLISVGLFLLASLHFPKIAGSAGLALNRSLLGFMGWSAFLLPWFLFLLGLQLFTPPPPLFLAGLLAAVFVFLLDFSIFLLIASGHDAAGGAVGKAMTALLKPPLGPAGLYILTLTIALLDLLAITRLSLKDLFSGFLGWIGRIMAERKNTGASSGDEEARYYGIYDGAPADDSERRDLSSGCGDMMEEVPCLEEETPAESVEPAAEDAVSAPPVPAEVPPAEKPQPEPVIAARAEDLPAGTVAAPAEERGKAEEQGSKPQDSEQLSLFPGEQAGPPAPAKTAAPPKKEVRRQEMPRYRLPNENLFSLSSEEEKKKKAPEDYSEILVDALHSFGVDARVINILRGPTVTRYELQLARGTKISKVKALSGDIAMVLAALSIRIEAPIPGKSAIGIEVPNLRIDPVHIRGIIKSQDFRKGSTLTFALGRDITGRPVVGDLAKMPHLLIAGATGSGKTVCLNTILSSLLFKASPLDVQFLIIDPKRVELIAFEGIPHTVDVGERTEVNGREVRKIVTDSKKATFILKQVTEEMDRRYDEFAGKRSRNIDEFNQECQKNREQPMPRLVIIIDELADLMMVAAREVETSICRLAQLGRACGIHLIVATQRPSVDVITGLIKANIPSRIAFAVASQVDARTVLDRSGAEKLLGKGDMLYLPIDAPEARRLQGAYIDKGEIEELVEYWQGQPEPTNLVYVIPSMAEQTGARESDEKDELMPEVLEVIMRKGKASASDLQRELNLGYPRAARLVDNLYKKGVVGPPDGSKPRKVLLSAEEIEQLIKGMKKVE
jgi:S-DNA-T family DNA segregation ATPase FtsK/SpoIIIE